MLRESTNQVSGIHWNDSFGSDADRDVIEETLGELLLHRLHVLLVQVGSDQSNAAVDVEADAACQK